MEFNAHFDGFCILPDKPLDLPAGAKLTIHADVDPDSVKPRKPRVIGAMKGLIEVPPSFEPLPTDVEGAFYGALDSSLP